MPLQAPAEAIARYAGVYDQGWDRQRELRFARQRAMGLIGPDWRLSQANPGVPRWDDVPEDKRPLMAHYMQVYAAMVELVDQEVGRLVTELKALGVYDNTLIVLTSDNGANSIGGPDGTVNTMEKVARATDAEMAQKRSKPLSRAWWAALTPLWLIRWAGPIAPTRRFVFISAHP